MAARARARETAGGAAVTIPVRLDAVVLRGLRRGAIPGPDGDLTGFLAGAWLTLTALLGTLLLLLSLAVPALWVRVVGALVCAVPGGMALLRGVVDAVSARGRLPAYTTSTLRWLVCYLLAAGGLLAAFAAP